MLVINASNNTGNPEGNSDYWVTSRQGWTGTKNRPWHFLVQAAHHHHIIYIYIYIYIYDIHYHSKVFEQ